MKKRIIIEIEDCFHCPFYDSLEMKDSDDVFICSKSKRELSFINTGEMSDFGGEIIRIPIPSDCPQEFQNYVTS